MRLGASLIHILVAILILMALLWTYGKKEIDLKKKKKKKKKRGKKKKKKKKKKKNKIKKKITENANVDFYPPNISMF